MPYLQHIGLFLVVVGGLVTIIVCAAMPAQHATSSFVWGNFDTNNLTGERRPWVVEVLSCY